MKFKFSFLALLIFLTFNVQAQKAQDEIRFSELIGDSNIQSNAINAVNESLIDRGFVPEEFFVILRENDEAYVFILIHQDAYLPERINITGNKSGKDHECKYHKLNNEIISCLYYQ